MPSIRFRLDGTSLDRLEEKVKAKYGVAARVLSTEEVRVGGIGGFFARRFMDVVVDVPELGAPAEWTAHRRVPLDEMLDRADNAELGIRADASPLPPLSTETDAFSDVLTELRRIASPSAPVVAEPPRRRRPVVLLRAPGDLVVIAGLGDDALTVANRLVAQKGPAEIAAGGSVSAPGAARVKDHRTAFAARARGIDSGRSTIVAFGIDPTESGLDAQAAVLAAIRPDQLWLAVDASRKAQDTERWVTALCTLVSVQAMAVVGTEWTSTPESVRGLGLPEAWSDAVG